MNWGITGSRRGRTEAFWGDSWKLAGAVLLMVWYVVVQWLYISVTLLPYLSAGAVYFGYLRI